MNEKHRAAILAAARKSFARYGFLESSLEDIARRAGLGQGFISFYFESKAELFSAVVRQVRKELFAELEAAVRGSSTPEEKLRTFVRIRQEQMERSLQELRLSPEAIAGMRPLVESVVVEQQAREVALLESILVEGNTQRAFTFGNPRAVARSVVEGLRSIERTLVEFSLRLRREDVQGPKS
ncbi:TetR/AcrR family transcriptional regulator [Hyalangium versicolor]|uniref:TetR/AcrR family transcriptional regulator n=1 Tax=Hyalangium versicolor TaxID=2861190 RepID=UPI001CCE0840|nr:TetR/AcrR family transcriptional regulator [Hyalangium versicolor]